MMKVFYDTETFETFHDAEPIWSTFAYSVQILHQTPFTPPRTSSPTSPATTPCPTPTLNTKPPAGLSIEAKAGIAVPVSIIGIEIICDVLFYLYRRRHQPLATDPSGVMERQSYI